jgi:hypothetical protein
VLRVVLVNEHLYFFRFGVQFLNVSITKKLKKNGFDNNKYNFCRYLTLFVYYLICFSYRQFFFIFDLIFSLLYFEDWSIISHVAGFET